METDTLIFGGSIAALAAALELKKAGSSVVVVTHRNYLGEDICDSLRLVLPADLDLGHPLAERLFGEGARSGGVLRPMHLKRELDLLCAEADIPVLFSTYPVALESRESEEGLTLTLQNRSGARSLQCRTLLDGTLRGEIARLAGLPLTPPDPCLQVVRRVLGGEPSALEEGRWEAEGEVVFEGRHGTASETLWAHHRQAVLEDGSWASWMKLEQESRLIAYRPGQKLSADGVFASTGERLHPHLPPAEVGGELSALPVEAVTACHGRLWFSGPVANVDPATREKLLRPDAALHHGSWIARHILDQVRLGNGHLGVTGALPGGTSIERNCEVLVVGGGTSGAPAAISAGRAGASTLVCEYLSGLGGVGTLGLIGKYWFGNCVGFTSEIDAGAASMTPEVFKPGQWNIEAKMQWYHQAASEAGVVVWYKTSLLQVLRAGDQITGAVLGTPQGPVTVRAVTTVDATGNADVTALAGGATVPVGDGHLAVQGTGLPGRTPGLNYGNTDYEFVDDSSLEDVSSAHLSARQKFSHAFDAGQLVDSRERRRIVGDYEVTPMDIRLTRVFPDSIVKARSNFDSHGFTIHPIFMIVPPDHDAQEAFVPLRALLTQGLECLLTTGLGISAHRDAMPVIRMQPDVQNQGYAAGRIAALAASQTHGRIRDLPIDPIQAHLVECGVLDPSVRGAPDSFPLPPAEVDRALASCASDPEQIDRVFTLPEQERISRLRLALDAAVEEPAKRFFSFVLGVLEEPAGWRTLAAEVAETPWDDGWDYTGMGQFGASLSPLDTRLIALGRCRQPESLPVLLEKASALPQPAAFSHYRALAEALATLGQPEGAEALQHLLLRPGILGHALTNRQQRLQTAAPGSSSTETRFRNAALIEIHLAAGLFRLDPAHTLARRTLEAYSRDLRGLFSRFARSLLMG